MHTTDNALLNKRFFTKECSAVIKGICMFLQVLHHLFGCRTYLTDASLEWIGIPFFNIMGDNTCRSGTPLFGAFKEAGGISLLEYELGWFGRIALPLIIFVSGYGLYHSFLRNTSFKQAYISAVRKIKNFLISWWVVLFLLAIPVALSLGNFSLKRFILSFIPLTSDSETLFISFGWYVTPYILFLLAMPLITYLINKKPFYYVAAPTLVFYALSLVYERYFMISYASTVNSNKLLIAYIFANNAYLFFHYVPTLVLGAIFAKYPLFEIAEHLLKKIRTPLYRKLICIFIIAAVFVARLKFDLWITTDIFYTPLFIFAVAYLTKYRKKGKDIITRFTKTAGDYSFEIWITHGLFFFSNIELQPLIFWPKLSVLIYALLFAISLGLAWCMRRMANLTRSGLEKAEIKLRGKRSNKAAAR